MLNIPRIIGKHRKNVKREVHKRIVAILGETVARRHGIFSLTPDPAYLTRFTDLDGACEAAGLNSAEMFFLESREAVCNAFLDGSISADQVRQLIEISRGQ